MAPSASWLWEMSRRGARLVEMVKIEIDATTTLGIVSTEELFLGYSPALISLTAFERAVDPFDRSHSIGDVTMTLKANGLVKDLVNSIWLQNRRVTIKLGTARLVEASFETIYRGRIKTWSQDAQGNYVFALSDLLGTLNRGTLTGKWAPIHPLEILSSLYSDRALATLDEYAPATFSPAAWNEISHWMVTHGGAMQLASDPGIDTPKNGRDVANDLCRLMNGTITTDSQGRDAFKRYDRNAPRVKHWTQDQIAGFELIDAHAYQANRMVVRAFGGGPVTDSLGPLKGNHIAGKLSVAAIDSVSITLDNAQAQADLAAPGELYRAIEKSLDTGGWTNAFDIFYSSPAEVYSGTPNTLSVPAAETRMSLVEPSLQGFCGAVPATAMSWRKVDGVRRSYLMMGLELIAVSAVNPDPTFSATTDTKAYYSEDVLQQQKDAIARRFGPNIAPGTQAYNDYLDAMTDLTDGHPYEFTFARRGEFGTQTPSEFVVVSYDPTQTSADWPHGFPSYPNVVMDATIAVDMAKTRLDRFAYGIPVVRFRVPLTELDVRLGDAVSFDRPSFQWRGVDGATSAVIWEVISVRIESSGPEPHVLVTLALMRLESIMVPLFTPGSYTLTRPTPPMIGGMMVDKARSKFGDLTVDGIDVVATTGRRGEMRAGRADSPGHGNLWPSKLEATFPASRDTYVRFAMTSGAILWEIVKVGDPEPALRSGHARVARVTTDASTITAILDQRSRRGVTAGKMRWPLTEVVEIANGNLAAGERAEAQRSRARIHQGKNSGTDNTAKTLYEWIPDENSCSLIRVLCTGKSATNYAALEVVAVVRRTTGNVTVSGVTTTSLDRSNAEMTATVDASGTSVRIRFQSRTGDTMQWSATVIEGRAGE